MGPAPIVPGQHFRPAPNAPQARPAGLNGLARPPRPQQTGPLQYGNAAKGIRPPPGKSPRPPSNDPQAKYQILRSMLTDNGSGTAQAKGDFVGGVFQAPPAPNVPKPAPSHLVPGQIPQIQPRSFSRPMHVSQNGHAGNGIEADGSTANGVRGGRGRGRGRGAPGNRGRGAPRGRGGHSGQGNPAQGASSQSGPVQGSS